MALALPAPTSMALRIGSNIKATNLIASNACCVAPINFHAGPNRLGFVSKVSIRMRSHPLGNTYKVDSVYAIPVETIAISLSGHATSSRSLNPVTG
jgi:hypothetical protein